MEAFKAHRGVIGVLDRSNVDTDQIIPKQFLKSIKRTGFGSALFFDWRYTPEGKDHPHFVLNHSHYQGASILATRNNFGCGSSREHAVWAVMQYGFKVVIAPWQQRGEVRVPAFADIFRNNSIANGLLTIELSEAEVDQIFMAVDEVGRLEATVDLENHRITLHTSPEKTIAFSIEPGVRDRHLKGLDEIGLTLQREAEVAAFEKRHDVQMA